MHAFAFLTIFDLVITLTFDLLASKSNPIIFVNKCTEIALFKNCTKRFGNNVRKLSGRTYDWTDNPKT